MSDLAEPLYRPLPLVAVALFAANNFYGKAAFPGFVTGKLSDVLACFFLALFVAAVLEPLDRFANQKRDFARKRDFFGSLVTIVLFTLVKTNDGASRFLDAVVSLFGEPLGIFLRPNFVDPTDLCALPMAIVAFFYSKSVRTKSDVLGDEREYE